MNNILEYGSYNDWQEKLILLFKESKKIDKELLSSMAKHYPVHKKRQENEETINMRIKNYGRINKDFGDGKNYERVAYLNDVYSLCKTLGLTPNDVFMDISPEGIGSFTNSNDIFRVLFNKTNMYKKFGGIILSDTFESNFVKDKAVQLPKDIIFNLLYYYYLVHDFEKTFKRLNMEIIRRSDTEFLALLDYDNKGEDANVLIEMLNNIKIMQEEKKPNGSLSLKKNPIMEHRDFEEHIRVSFEKGMWRYHKGFVENDFYDIDNFEPINTYKAWNKDKQFKLTLHFYALKTILRCLRKHFEYLCEDKETDFKKYCLDYLRETPRLQLLMCKLFNGSIMVLNSNYISWDVTVMNNKIEKNEVHSKPLMRSPTTSRQQGKTRLAEQLQGLKGIGR